MALLRSQICVEQSNLTNQAKFREWFNIWVPLGTKDNEWTLHTMSPHNGTVDGVVCHDHGMTYACKCCEGSYIPALVGSAGLSFPGGNWSSDLTIATTGAEGWRYIKNSSIESRNMRLTVPAGTTRLYMIPYTATTLGVMDITLVSGTANIVLPSIDLNLDTTTLDVDNGGGAKYTGIPLIARDCGGAVLNFIGKSGAAIGCSGFICINDDGDSDNCNPYDGVFDPDSMVEVMVYETGGIHQIAEGPLSLNNSSSWWGNGHWDANNTLINESETLYYQDVDDDSWVDWTTVNTVNTHIRKKAWSLGRTLIGDIQVNISGTNYTVGTHKAMYSVSPAGFTITLDHIFNATAEAQGLAFASRGGYGGQWSISKGFAAYAKSLPGVDDTNKYVIGSDTFVDGTTVYSQNTNCVSLYGGISGYEAHVKGEGIILSGGGTILKSSPLLWLVERNTSGVEYIKAYLNNKYDDSTLLITEGDRATGRHTRYVTKTELTPTYTNYSEITLTA